MKTFEFAPKLVIYEASKIPRKPDGTSMSSWEHFQTFEKQIIRGPFTRKELKVWLDHLPSYVLKLALQHGVGCSLCTSASKTAILHNWEGIQRIYVAPKAGVVFEFYGGSE